MQKKKLYSLLGAIALVIAGITTNAPALVASGVNSAITAVTGGE